VGAELYLREAYRLSEDYDDLSPREAWAWCTKHGFEPGIHYEADSRSRGPLPSTWGRLRPAIHMLESASRAVLTVTSLGVERLHRITFEEVVAEGLDDVTALDYRWRFAALWDWINGKRPGGAWAHNPWVFVVGYEVTRDTLVTRSNRAQARSTVQT